MTNPVQLIIESGGTFLCSYQEVHGEIIEEGKTEQGEEYIVFRDEESERRIPKKKIKNINTNVKHSNTAELQGG